MTNPYKGKALVRKYGEAYETQSAFRENHAYALQSTKTSMDAAAVFWNITSVCLRWILEGDNTCIYPSLAWSGLQIWRPYSSC